MSIRRPTDQRRTFLADINITPVCDVALVLLIMFMLTAPLLQQGLPVNLPKASSPAIKRTKKDVILTIRKGGSIYIGDDNVSIPPDEIEARLTAIFSAKKNSDLFIKADSNLKYGTVVRIMALAKKAGVSRIGMITQPDIKQSS